MGGGGSQLQTQRPSLVAKTMQKRLVLQQASGMAYGGS